MWAPLVIVLTLIRCDEYIEDESIENIPLFLETDSFQLRQLQPWPSL